jgi:5-methylcytosine-specific restriction endonuclease McrA
MKNQQKRRQAFKQWRTDHRDEVNAWHRVYIKEYRQGKRRKLLPPVVEQARPTDVRLCPTCGGVFSLTEFPRRGTECRSCWNKRQPKYRNKAKRAVYGQNRRARAVGLVTPEDWQAVLERHAHRCAYCGVTGKLTMDHVVALAKGGKHEPSNIVPACAQCNSRKHTKAWQPRIDPNRDE